MQLQMFGSLCKSTKAKKRQERYDYRKSFKKSKICKKWHDQFNLHRTKEKSAIFNDKPELENAITATSSSQITGNEVCMAIK